MPRFRITYDGAGALRAAIEQELSRGAVLVKVAPPDGLEFRDAVALELCIASERVAVEAEVVSLFPDVGVALAVPAACLEAVRALALAAPEAHGGTTIHEFVPDPVADAVAHADAGPAADAATDAGAGPAAARPAASAKPTVAERIRLALHGTRDDRAAILRDPDRSLHAFVLKSPKVSLDEVTAWAKNPQMTTDFLKQLGERKDWLTRASVAQGLVRNPKTPPELALRALDYVGGEALRTMARGLGGVPPAVAAAAKKKVMSR